MDPQQPILLRLRPRLRLSISMASWLSISLPNPFKSLEEEEEEEEEGEEDIGNDVREDLSELTKTIGRQIWGVASFLAPLHKVAEPQKEIKRKSAGDHLRPRTPPQRSSAHPLAKMKAFVKGRYAAEKSSAAATLTLNAGDVKLRASMTDATIVTGPSLDGLTVSLDKPGAFMIDYNVQKRKKKMLDFSSWTRFRQEARADRGAFFGIRL